mmetsp:Transcript_141013/g.450186  ORF Transcript_141013/g.450186 Transcript_141013/m.450186 type:complete len:502 (+) Transcript_141013:120-1625(+)
MVLSVASLLWFFGACAVTVVLLLGALLLGLRWYSRRCSGASEITRVLKGRETIGFFHPYAHAGGGGERVLWCAIHAVQESHPGVVCIVYTGDIEVEKPKFLELARDRFGVEVKADTVEFVHVRKRWWVEASTWRRFTLLGQSFGSVILGWEALCSFRPDVFIDSMGYAFTFPLFALVGSCRIGCYVHYPTISTDMLARVKSRDLGVCNDGAVARSGLLSSAKLLYYKAFAWVYSIVGRFAEVVMVNSSWTGGHINTLWKIPDRTSVVFPPCDTRMLAALPLDRCLADGGGFLVLSLAQFRPEKDHPLQLRALARLFELVPQHREQGAGRVRLILAGGCRDDGDRGRVAALRALGTELGLRQRGAEQGGETDWDFDFRTNISMSEMKELLGKATVGLHTMREEHFGINVVEFMAAGAIPLAHNSGGPKMDIVTPLKEQRTGFLANDDNTYAAALKAIFALSSEERTKIAAAARASVRDRFAQEAFERAFSDNMVAPLRRGQP